VNAGEPLEWKALPETHIWNNVGGTNYLTEIKNQHIPQYCGSCWAQAASSSLSDRIKIARKAAWPDINIAPQVLISCSGDDGCHGGEAYNALEWMHHNQISDETCAIYRARGHDNGMECSQQLKCDNCLPGQGCFAQDNYKIYMTETYGHVSGEEAMMQEIYQRGPIACGIVADEKLVDYKGGIFNNDTPYTPDDIDHDISVVGFGVDNGTKYWVVRNSWGSAWGEQGFFRLIRGTNNIMIETDCAWGVPLDTWTNDVRHHLTEEEKKDIIKPTNADIRQEDLEPENHFLKEKSRTCRTTEGRENITQLPPKVTPLEEHIASGAVMPTSWDWRAVNGVNYLSWNKNQHIPVYCGSCWA
jgi:cathepsin X